MKRSEVFSLLLRLLFPIVTVILCVLMIFVMRNTIPEENCIYLDDTWSYSLNLNDSIFLEGDEAVQFSQDKIPLNKHNFNKINKLINKRKGFIQLHNEFVVPEHMQDINLGLYSSGMKIASEVFINGYSVGKEGFFPDENGRYDFGPGTSGHAYTIPHQLLNYEGTNEITVTLWVNGVGSISKGTFISDYDSVYYEIEKHNFFFSKVNFGFALVCIIIGLFYMFIFAHRKRGIENLFFAFMCFFSAFFLVAFFINELIWIDTNTMLYLTFNKIFFAVPAFMAVYFAVNFMIAFLEMSYPKVMRISRIVHIISSCNIILFLPTYVIFCKVVPVLFILQILPMVYPIIGLIKDLLNKKKNAFILIGGFLPVITCIVMDILLHGFFEINNIPLMTIYGWQVTLLAFLYILSYKYNVIYQEYEYLATELESEVNKKTSELTIVNNHLLQEKAISKRDMDMAVNVQKSFLPDPDIQFENWDIAVAYKPVAGVSGDFYDYYEKNGKLEGFSLFDVSGHGISSGLVTMLAKVQVAEQFKNGLEKKLHMDEVMLNINNSIISAKGEVENYLTGVLVNFNKKNSFEYVCAGHPSPIRYDSKNNTTEFIYGTENGRTFCMVGFDGFTPEYTLKECNVNTDDLLIFYTDGITEAENKEGKQFGKDRLVELIQTRHSLEPVVLLESIMDAVKAFTDGVPFEDDVSIIIFKRK